MDKILSKVVTVLSIMAALCGAIYFIEDRYIDEKEAVITIRQQQQINNLDLVELWREQERNLDLMCGKNPDNKFVKERLERAKRRIKELEKKIYGERYIKMKKLLAIALASMLVFSTATMVYAGGDQNQENHCADKAQGPAGDTAQGDATRNRAAAD